MWGYMVVAKPLTDLTKRGGFKWSEESEYAVFQLKRSLVTALVLALPALTKPFIVETDASQYGIRAVLMQDRHPVAFSSITLFL